MSKKLVVVTCEFCAFKQDTDRDEKMVFCRINPPVIRHVPSSESFVEEGYWPLVRADDWCGQWVDFRNDPLTKRMEEAEKAATVCYDFADRNDE